MVALAAATTCAAEPMAIALGTANSETITARQTDKTSWRENIPDFLDVIFLVNSYCIKV
jgi:hypothetical protein